MRLKARQSFVIARHPFFVMLPVLTCCSVFALGNIATAQQSGSYLITTVAGNGSAGFSGDGGPATTATLLNPSEVTLDISGNVYILDADNHRIRKVATVGTITTIAGNGKAGFSGDGPATAETLGESSGLAVDTSGNLYIAEYQYNRIRKVSLDGLMTTIAGGQGAGFSGDGGPAVKAQLNFPAAIVVDASSNLYIADSFNHRIRKVSPNGIITTIAGNGSIGLAGDGGPATSATLSYPFDLVADSSNNLYFSDGGSIRKVSTSGIISTVAAGLPESGLAVDASGNAYVADGESNLIRKVSGGGSITTIAGNGSTGFSGDGGPAIQVSRPAGLALDAMGNLYVAETGNQRVRKLVFVPQSSVGCAYTIDQSSQTLSSNGGNAHVGVLASESTCPWLAISYSDWVTPSSVGAGTGTGLVTYTVAPNPSSASRTSTIWIAGQSLTVNQSGIVCSFSVNPKVISLGASGVTGNILGITSTAPDCQRSATANVPWILVSAEGTATGSGSVTYTVGINTGGLRTGTISVGGSTVFINQVGVGDSVSSLATISSNGVVNGASYTATIEPGSFVTIYGQNLADSTTDWSAAIKNGQLPTTLGGVQVLINGKNAFIYYVQPTQINAIAQPDTASGSIEVDVLTNHGTIPAQVNMVPISPGLFMYSLQGTLYAASVFSTDGAYVGAVGAIPGVTSRPARAGDYILLFATGLGTTNPPYPVGKVLTSAYPVPDLSTVSVLIGGTPATVQFAGMTYSGLFQINIQIPSGIPAGDQPIVLGVAGQASLPAVYLTLGGG